MNIKIVGFAGSLRAASYNKKLLRVAAAKAGALGAAFQEIDLSAVPLYNEDVERAGFPVAVQKMREAIAAADGVIIATPEYNYSVSGATKNAIDWASRQPNAFTGKPVAIMGASAGGFATVRAQAAIRPILASVDALVLPSPEVRVSKAGDAFDAGGALKDAALDGAVGKLVGRLVSEIEIRKAKK